MGWVNVERICTFVVSPHLAKISNPYHLIFFFFRSNRDGFPFSPWYIDCSSLMVDTLFLSEQVTVTVKKRCLDSLSVSFVVRFHIQRSV